MRWWFINLELQIHTAHVWWVCFWYWTGILTSNLLKGEQAHKLIKRIYWSSNKKDVVPQFAKQERQGTFLRWQLNQDSIVPEMEQIDQSPQIHHSMANTPRRDNVFSLSQMLYEHRTDLTVKVSMIFWVRVHLMNNLNNRQTSCKTSKNICS